MLTTGSFLKFQVNKTGPFFWKNSRKTYSPLLTVKPAKEVVGRDKYTNAFPLTYLSIPFSAIHSFVSCLFHHILFLFTMKSLSLLSVAVAALVSNVSAAGVTGTPEGFASEVTGGGSAEGAYPKSTDELVSMLGDSTTRVILLDQEFDFTGTEGTASEQGCAPWGTGSGCQTAINKDDWCNNYQPDAPKVDVSYDKAGLNPIIVNSDKSIVGVGANGVIKGKGLYIKGTKNIIIQNIHITELNPQYVWGGDAITLDGADLVWIDHVTTSNIGRQHIVLGTNADNRVSITNNHINGESQWSATCDGHQYWSMYFTGSSDVSPKISPSISNLSILIITR